MATTTKSIPALKAVGQHTIKGVMATQYARPRGVDAFNVRVSSDYCYSYTSFFQMQQSESSRDLPLGEYFERKWKSRTDPLWWSVMSPMAIGKRRTIRSYQSRRLREAFTKALEAKGFDKQGNRILDGVAPPLRGSVQITAMAPVLKAKMPELEAQMDLVVGQLVRMLGRASFSKKAQQRSTSPRHIPRK